MTVSRTFYFHDESSDTLYRVSGTMSPKEAEAAAMKAAKREAVRENEALIASILDDLFYSTGKAVPAIPSFHEGGSSRTPTGDRVCLSPDPGRVNERSQNQSRRVRSPIQKRTTLERGRVRKALVFKVDKKHSLELFEAVQKLKEVFGM